MLGPVSPYPCHIPQANYTPSSSTRSGHDPSKLFQRSVNKRNVPDYYDIIKEPMALSILKQKINKREYKQFSEFVRDCALVIIPCSIPCASGQHVGIGPLESHADHHRSLTMRKPTIALNHKHMKMHWLSRLVALYFDGVSAQGTRLVDDFTSRTSLLRNSRSWSARESFPLKKRSFRISARSLRQTLFPKRRKKKTRKTMTTMKRKIPTTMAERKRNEVRDREANARVTRTTVKSPMILN